MEISSESNRCVIFWKSPSQLAPRPCNRILPKFCKNSVNGQGALITGGLLKILPRDISSHHGPAHHSHHSCRRLSWCIAQVGRPWVNPITDLLRTIQWEDLMSSLVNALSGRVGGSWKRKAERHRKDCCWIYYFLQYIDTDAEENVLINALWFWWSHQNWAYIKIQNQMQEK